MIDILYKYYGIKVDYYNKYNEGIIFFVNGDYYYFFNTILTEEDLQSSILVNQLKQKGIVLHDYILNNYNNILSEGYVLIKLNYLIEDVTFDEILRFNVNSSVVSTENFYDKWIDRLDYLEKQLIELSENKLINNSYDYFLGIAEQLLYFYKDNYNDNNSNYLSHRYFLNLNSIDFYNPTNIIVDNKYKDIASYIHITGNWELLNNVLDTIDENDKIYLFIRLSFPFKFLNCINQYVTGDLSKDLIIKDYINDIEKYEKYLLKIDELFKYNLFYWIKKDN